MRPVFPNSALVRAPEWLLLRGGRKQSISLKVRYGIVRHPVAGLILIDTGYGPRVTQGPRNLPLRIYSRLLAPSLIDDGQPETALRRMGATVADVRAIVVTHFHADHVAGLHLFPQARIYAHRGVLEAILARGTWRNLRHGVFAELLPPSLAERTVDIAALPRREASLELGMGADLLGDGSLLAVDLPGHAEGHFGVCFARLPVPLLSAVDVQWLAAALPNARRPGFPANLIADDRQALAESAGRVAAFRANGGDVLLCHDPHDSLYDMRDQGT